MASAGRRPPAAGRSPRCGRVVGQVGEEFADAPGERTTRLLGPADLERAADGISAATFYNAGQDCTAACSVLVAAEAHDRLVALLADLAATSEVGPLNSRA
ncbi:aldehyde dehydrogenase family protein [Nonomuraea sp. NPDC003804]|uniref:aldehyde dehydrogenase family protein n=1 Tax=Nonomuraea sp. NPDC003804 TaxID=3154547 RepID=UPI0033B22CCF